MENQEDLQAIARGKEAWRDTWKRLNADNQKRIEGLVADRKSAAAERDRAIAAGLAKRLTRPHMRNVVIGLGVVVIGPLGLLATHCLEFWDGGCTFLVVLAIGLVSLVVLEAVRAFKLYGYSERVSTCENKD